MSFFFETISIPFWFIVFIFFSAAPLWLKWYKIFYSKFIITGLLKKIFRRTKSAAEMKIDILKKATNHWNENSELSGFTDSSVKQKKTFKKKIDPVRKQNIQTVLKMLAASGETGVLSKSISDKTDISPLDTANALTYLTDKNYAELINSTNGKKYYLTDLGRRYCINKQYI